MIVVVDYGMGNIKSITNMLDYIGYNSIVSNEINDIKKASKLILPGVGAFNSAMENLAKFNLINVLNKKVLQDKTPILGICLGLQIMAKNSAEDNKTNQGLGWFEAEVKKFTFSNDHKLPVPHMGWNKVEHTKKHQLFNKLTKESKMYFVHTYHIECQNGSDILATTDYGYNFTCAIAKDNIMAVQFHPEKSHRYGIQLLRNFAEYV